MLDYKTIPGSGKYPTNQPSSTSDQSSNFITPFKVNTGTMRGTQGVGFTGPLIDSANNRITVGGITLDGNTSSISVTATDGSVQGIGIIPNTTQTGFYSVDSSGNLIFKIVNGTLYFYNPVDSYNNNIIIGRAPTDNRTGIWVAKLGQSALTLLGG